MGVFSLCLSRFSGEATANPNAPLSGYGDVTHAYLVPTWHAPIAQEQYAKMRAAGRTSWYAARANRAYDPSQQHHITQSIALGN
jgi:hypothetical protein